MNAPRRFSEREIAKIFERAARDQETATGVPGPADGLTLAELKDIGREVGIEPVLITRAAHALDVAPPGDPVRRMLGTPIGVSHTVPLPRPLTDDEWARLVVDLRETFDARGELREQGPFRQWTNGNLQALLEPTGTGARLRLRTVRGGARESLLMGATMLSASPVVVALTALTGALGDGLPLAGTLAAAGAAFLVAGRIRFPRWAATRRRQMEAIAERLAAAIRGDP